MMFRYPTIFYTTIKKLSPVEQGEVLRAAMEYSVCGEEPEGLSIAEEVVFALAKHLIDTEIEQELEDEWEGE